MAAACLLGSVPETMSDYVNVHVAPRSSDDMGERISNQRHWYAVRVRPRWEKIVAEALEGKQYEGFLPLYRKRSQWSDRVKDIDLPLFPGYVFLRGCLEGRPLLVTTPGVIDILRFGNAPAMIADEEIEAVKAVLRAGAYAEPWRYVREGERVRIQRGSLAGIEGVLVHVKNDSRLVLSVDALCRSVAVEIDRDWVVPVSKRFTHASELCSCVQTCC
jgi:transcription antitermination factor NusG